VANLLNNSAKYQNERAGSSFAVTPSGSEALISVKGQRRGIAPEMQAQIFELFSQGERTPIGPQGGSASDCLWSGIWSDAWRECARDEPVEPARAVSFWCGLPCLPEEPEALTTPSPDLTTFLHWSHAASS
jgi:hypothetical protein